MAPGVSQLKELDSGTLANLLKVANVLCGALAFGVAGCWHVYHIVTCSDEDENSYVVCMSFFAALSSSIIALYIMCGAHANALFLPPRLFSRRHLSLSPRRLRSHSPLSLVLLMYEMTRGKTEGRIRSMLERNTGFIFLYNRRFQYLILCATAGAAAAASSPAARGTCFFTSPPPSDAPRCCAAAWAS